MFAARFGIDVKKYRTTKIIPIAAHWESLTEMTGDVTSKADVKSEVIYSEGGCVSSPLYTIKKWSV